MKIGFIGEIRMFGGSYAPEYWALCKGQTLLISDYGALYSLIGTVYGGDAIQTFCLPDMQGRIPVHCGGSAGPDLSQYRIGQRGGQETHVLTTDEIPGHTHPMYATSELADSGSPDQACVAIGGGSAPVKLYGTYDKDKAVTLDSESITYTGVTSPPSTGHDNIMPMMPLNYIICLDGNYPQRS